MLGELQCRRSYATRRVPLGQLSRPDKVPHGQQVTALHPWGCYQWFPAGLAIWPSSDFISDGVVADGTRFQVNFAAAEV